MTVHLVGRPENMTIHMQNSPEIMINKIKKYTYTQLWLIRTETTMLYNPGIVMNKSRNYMHNIPEIVINKDRNYNAQQSRKCN